MGREIGKRQTSDAVRVAQGQVTIPGEQGVAEQGHMEDL